MVDIKVVEGDGSVASGYVPVENYPIDKCKTLVRDFMEDVSTMDENQGDKKKGICRDKTIVIELRGKDLPNLDLLDLPGLKQKAKKDESDSVIEDTKKLVEDTIDKVKEMSIFLAIRAATFASLFFAYFRRFRSISFSYLFDPSLSTALLNIKSSYPVLIPHTTQSSFYLNTPFAIIN